MTACICRPRDPEGWYREDCPTHGREAEGARCPCGHDDERHGPEAGGCIECPCRAPL